MVASLIGCATPAHYAWGQYEDLVYDSYAKPGATPPEKQVEKLEEDYQKARSTNKPVPPGWHAHLGYLYFQLGKSDQARQEFETEKATFPESAVFMDRLLAKFEKR
ncbi:MAG: DUF4810 domain-containing protein [Elusimicrobiota bacterium]